jgi:hypothetical protein
MNYSYKSTAETGQKRGQGKRKPEERVKRHDLTILD